MPKGKDKPQKHLKQASLLSYSSSPAKASPDKRSSRAKKVESSTSAATTSTRKRKQRTREPPPEESDSDVGAIHFQPERDDSDPDQSLQPSPVKRRKTQVLESDGEDSDVEEQHAPERRIRKRAPAPDKHTIHINLSSGDEEPPRKKKTRLHKGRRKPQPKEDTDSDDLSEDRIIEARLRTRDKKTTFQKNLEKLRRKKQGKPIESSGEEEEHSQASASEEEPPIKGAKQDGIDSDSEHDSLFDEDSQDEESFIIEDGGDGSALLPAEFRSQQDLAHHFKTIFQLFVHVAVCLPVERGEFMEKQLKDDYFSVPLHTTRRKIDGLRDSSVASSVWQPEFKKALETLPNLELFRLDYSVPECDACHLGGRVSTLRGDLGGLMYDKMGFQEYPDSDEESDSDKKKKKKKSKKKKKEKGTPKRKKPKFKTSLHLGRFCAKRTRVYHELSHWEYHLYKTIEDEVDDLHAAEQEDTGYVRVAFAGGKKPPKDLNDADGICEWLDQRQFIDREWQKLKKLMESATQLDVAAKKGEED